MKIFRPDELAVLYRSFRFARRNTLAVGMLGLFPFDRSELAGLRPEPELWDAVARAMGEGLLDEGYPKPAGEFKVYGSAHAPGGKPVQEMLVSAKVGSVLKQLLVIGDRHFNAVGLISQTSPFVSMPLTPGQAFGGPDEAANPAGKGAAATVSADGVAQWPLPNVERMRQRITSRGDRVEPAGFWAVDATAPLRTAQLGKCDDQWLKHTWPHLPEDTRTEYFHTVPADQRNPGYYVGDEVVELHGMHPQQATLTARLPGLRARCFIHRQQVNGAERFSEIEARLDTVWLFPELSCGIVLYRAQSDVADEDASDVLHVMAEWERLQDAPLSFGHYEALFDLYRGQASATAVAADTVPANPVASATQLPPLPAVVMPAATVAAAAAAPFPELGEAQQAIIQLERETAELMQRFGITPADLAALEPPPAVPTDVSIAEAERAIADLERETQTLMRQHNLSEADALKMEVPQAPPGSGSLAEAKASVLDLQRSSRELMRQHKLSEADIEKFAATRPGAEPGEAVFGTDVEALLQNVPDVLPDWPEVSMPPPVAATQALAAVAIPTLAQAPAALPKLTREQVIELHTAKHSLRGYDLCGVDLSKLDLSAADFSGSLLEGAVFAGSRLAHADLSACLMQGADCSEADFSNANLAQASAGGAKFAKARLPGARMQEGDFTGADFTLAQLPNAVLDDAIFSQAAMSGVQAAGCTATHGNFSGADLSGADFGQARLHQAMFNESKLAASNFKAAYCEEAEFYGADATGAQFVAAIMGASRADGGSQFSHAVFDGAQLQRAAWEGAQLTAARFVGAILDDADFSQVKASGASFRQASARHAKFGRADLSQADLSGINLFKGSLRKARVEAAVLHFANAYGADLEGCTLRASALEGAHVERTILTVRPPLA